MIKLLYYVIFLIILGDYLQYVQNAAFKQTILKLHANSRKDSVMRISLNFGCLCSGRLAKMYAPTNTLTFSHAHTPHTHCLYSRSLTASTLQQSHSLRLSLHYSSNSVWEFNLVIRVRFYFLTSGSLNVHSALQCCKSRGSYSKSDQITTSQKRPAFAGNGQTVQKLCCSVTCYV